MHVHASAANMCIGHHSEALCCTLLFGVVYKTGDTLAGYIHVYLVLMGCGLHGCVKGIVRRPDIALERRRVHHQDIQALQLLCQLGDSFHLLIQGILVLSLQRQHQGSAHTLSVHLYRENRVAGNLA